MSYQEKRVAVSIFTGVALLLGYFYYVSHQLQMRSEAEGDLKYFATVMLVFIGIGIVVVIVTQIIFHILMSIGMAIQEKIEKGQVDEASIERSIKVEMMSDERDKIIELKALRVGFAVAGIGMVAGLIALVLDFSSVMMLNIIFVSFWMGSIIEGCVQLYFYRKG